MKDLRPNGKNSKAKTFLQLDTLTKAEQRNTRAKAAAVLNQEGEGETPTQDVEVLSMIEVAQSAKKFKGVEGRRAASTNCASASGGASTGVGGIAKGSGAAGDVNFTYISWGFSQKVQLQGVLEQCTFTM